jgi:hypothetical protein
MKPGYRSSEFWITVVGQCLALLALTGAINVGDKDKLETALANAITAGFTLIGSAAVVIRYISSRTELKGRLLTDDDVRNPLLPLLAPLAVVAGLLCAAPAHAQAPVAKTCIFIINRRPRTDPAVTATLQQLAQNQQVLMTLLQQQRQPLPSPSIVLLAPPAQQIPLGGPPAQQIPLGGPPAQQVPLGTPPVQQVPLGPPPVQQVPLGPPPVQQIPLGEPKPLMTPPGIGKPAGVQQFVPAVAYRGEMYR